MTRQFEGAPAGAGGEATVPPAFARRTSAEREQRTARHRRPPTSADLLGEASADSATPGGAPDAAAVEVLPAIAAVLAAEDEALVRQVRELRAEADRGRRALVDAGREREALRQRLADVEAERDMAAARLLEVERVPAVEDAVRRREEQQAESESESAALQGHIDDLQRERDHLARLMADASSAATRAADQQRSDATAHATQLTALVDALRADAAAERARHEQSLADARAALAEFREKAAAEIGEWRTQLEQAAREHEASLAETLLTLAEQGEEADKRVAAAEHAVHEVQRERDRAVADVERLTALMEAARAVSARDAASRVQAERERDAERQQWNETFARLTAIEEQVRGAVSSRTAPTLDRPVAARRPRPQRSL